jgi:hypothetical protein
LGCQERHQKELLKMTSVMRVKAPISHLDPCSDRECQHFCKWRNVGTKSQGRRDSFGSNALLSMEIDALAARTPECCNAELGKRKGFDDRFGEDFETPVGPDTLVLAERRHCVRSRAMKL